MLAKLRAAGIETACGLLENEARELNMGFVSRMTRGRPWLRLKVAASLDGKTALNNGLSQWITGPEARRDGHRWRARACAILTGMGTVRDDDPSLTVRDVETPRQPLRVVVDSRLETPPTAKILQGGGVLIAAAVDVPEKAKILRSTGAEVLVLPSVSGKVDLRELLVELGRRGINEVHAEAGFKLNGSLLCEGLVDEFLFYLAPCLIGHQAAGLFNLPELLALDGKQRLQIRDVRQIGADIRLIARPSDAKAGSKLGPNKLIMRWLAHRGGALDFREHQLAHPGQPFPVAVVLGCDPATILGAVTPVPDSLSEYQFAGLLRGAKTELTQCVGSSLQVPAYAEIVLEGHIHPGEIFRSDR